MGLPDDMKPSDEMLISTYPGNYTLSNHNTTPICHLYALLYLIFPPICIENHKLPYFKLWEGTSFCFACTGTTILETTDILIIYLQTSTSMYVMVTLLLIITHECHPNLSPLLTPSIKIISYYTLILACLEIANLS